MWWWKNSCYKVTLLVLRTRYRALALRNKMLEQVTTRYGTLQHVTTRYNMLQHVTGSRNRIKALFQQVVFQKKSTAQRGHVIVKTTFKIDCSERFKQNDASCVLASGMVSCFLWVQHALIMLLYLCKF